MKNIIRTNGLNKIFSTAICMIAVILLCAILFVPNLTTAQAESTETSKYDWTAIPDVDWETEYENYVHSNGLNRDWYNDSQYLDVDGAMAELEKIFADPNFNKEALKNDPIVIAVADSGFSSAYILDNGVKKQQGAEAVLLNADNLDLKYEIHPIFENVLLQDAEGNYVYHNAATTVYYYDRYDFGNEHILHYPEKSGGTIEDMAKDLFSFSHGIGVAGKIAYYIHAFGLEDYIKILPIKMDDYFKFEFDEYGTATTFKQLYSDAVLGKAYNIAYELGADILNWSVSGMNEGTFSEEMAENMLIVQASGNEGQKTDDRYPSVHDNVLSVMNYVKGTGDSLAFAPSSNWGPICDIVAPGDDTVIPAGLNGKFTLQDGTSAAAPTASFASALALFRFRGYNNYNNTNIKLTSKVLKEMIPHCSDQTVAKSSSEIYPALDFKNILTYDFYNDPAFLEKVTGVRIYGDFPAKFVLGDTVHAKAVANPVDFNEGETIKWWIDIDGTITDLGTGEEIDYTVDKVAKSYKIYCAYVDENGNSIAQCNAPYEFTYLPESLTIIPTYSTAYIVKTKLNFNAKPNPEGSKSKDLIHWWLEDKEGNKYTISRGNNLINKQLPNVVGEFTLHCAYEDPFGNHYAEAVNPQSFKVIYKDPTTVELIGADKYENLQIGDAIKLTYDRSLIDPESAKTAEWYVNGTKVNPLTDTAGRVHAFTMQYTVAEYGSYTVAVKVNGEEVVSKTFHVVDPSAIPDDLTLTMSGDVKEVYKVKNVDYVDITPTIYPADCEGEYTYTWWISSNGREGKELTSGNTYRISIPDAAAHYEVYCKLKNADGAYVLQSSNSFIFDVVYYEPAELSIEGNVDNIKKGDNVTLTYNTSLLSPTLASKVEWFVDGVKVADGGTLDYTATAYGNYAIAVKVNGVVADEITFDVLPDEGEVENTLAITSNATEKMIAGDNIVLNANFEGYKTGDNVPTWSCTYNGETSYIGSGWQVTFKPENAGEYTISCNIILEGGTLVEQTNTIDFKVESWQEIYDAYITNKGDDADWYLDEQYLDMHGAIEEISKMLSDPNFDKASLALDPIVIAVVEAGFSVVYSMDEYGNPLQEVGFTHTMVNKSENVTFRMHPVFEDVVLTDSNGDYVYANLATEATLQDHRTTPSTYTTLSWENNGDMAHDLVSFYDHGVGVAGVIAYFIHQFGLEDYIKIMPIKIGNYFTISKENTLSIGFGGDIVVEAFRYASENGADIINASLGGSKESNYEGIADKTLIVGSAGNTNANEQRFPSGLDSVLGVMGYVNDADGNLVLYQGNGGSTYGQWYDIVAPSEPIIVPCFESKKEKIFSYKTMGGTSSATPVVSFASALAMMRFRGYDNYGVDFEPTTRFFKEMIPYCSDQVATRVDDSGKVHQYPALDFKNILTYDFLADEEFLALVGIEIDNTLTITSNATEKMHAGDNIVLNATFDGYKVGDNLPTWSCTYNGETSYIGSGWQVTFKPENVGEYTISCSLVLEGGMIVDQVNTIEFKIESWQELYDAYLKENGKDADWYLDEQYLDMYGAIEEISKMLSDPSFDKSSLALDPIVIAVVEAGFSVVYSMDEYGNPLQEVGFTHTMVNKSENVTFRMHPVFEDVVLTDSNGDYVYANLATEATLQDHRTTPSTYTTLSWENNGDMAHDLVSFYDHGVGVAGVIAYFIHQFGLEDYIKIMPIKIGNYFTISKENTLSIGFGGDIVVEAFRYASENGADIINASLGGSKESNYEGIADKTLIVGSAGNTNANEQRFPSGLDSVLGVMGYVNDADGNLVLYQGNGGSTYGQWYDIVAPSEPIIVPCFESKKEKIFSYKTMGGTSSATPVVSFASALAMMRFRGYDNYGVDFEPTTRFFKEMIPYCSDQVATRVDDSGKVHQYPALDFKNILTYDFYDDVNFLEKIGVDVDKILGISSTAQEINMSGDVVSFTATTNIGGLFEDNNIGWWYELDGVTYEIGYGWNIDFQLTGKVGTYSVYCAILDNDGNMIAQCGEPSQFDVYLKPESLDISGNIQGEYKVDITASATLTATIGKEEYSADTPHWWIVRDGIHTSDLGTGWSIVFDLPNVVGNYEIFCGLKDAEGTVYAQCQNALEFAVTYYAVESISINGNVESEYKVDNTASVELSVAVNPTNAHVDGTFIWICESNGTKTEIGRGATIELDVPNEVGTYKVYCTYNDIQSTNTLEFAVTYYAVESISINGSVEDEYKVDNTASVELSVAVNPNNAHVDGTFIWICESNGTKTEIGRGATIELDVPNEVGEYKIYCTYGEMVSTNILEFVVTYYAVESISINGNVESEYKVDNTEKVQLAVSVNPSNAHVDGTFIWICESNGTKTEIGRGATIELDVPNDVGTYKVYCTYGEMVSTNTLEFAVTYYAVESISINGNVEDEYKVDNDASVELSVAVNPTNAHVDGEFIWICESNGTKTEIGRGATIELDIPNEVGTYKVYCTYNDIQSTNTLEFAVTYYAVESISINGSVEREYKVDNTASVELSVAVNPTNAHVDGTFIWICESNGVKTEIGRGASVELDVPNEVGTYKVYCTYGEMVSTNTLEFAVAYYAPTHVNVQGDIDAEYKVDNTEKVLLTASLNQYEITDDDFYWWYEIGGRKHAIGTGAIVLFSIPNVAGEYTIFCGLKDASGNVYAQCEEGVEFAVTYYAPTALIITSNAQGEYKVDNTEKVLLTASLNQNEYTDDIPYWWLVGDNNYFSVLGSGWEIEFDIPNVAGEYAIFCGLKDASGNVYAQCEEGVEFAVTYYAPTSVRIDCNVEDEYKIDTTASVIMRASLTPSNAQTNDTLCWWYVLDETPYDIGTGMSIEFDIPNVAGQYKVYCAFVDGNGLFYSECTNPVEFAVTYYTIEEVEFIAPEEIEIGDVPSFKVSNILAPEIADGIEWYVNDRLASTGAGFSIVILEAGTYKVTAKVDGQLYEIGTYTIEGEEEPPVQEDEDPEVLPPADNDNNGTESDPQVTEDTDKTLVAIIIALSAVSVAGVVTSCAMGAKLRGKSKKNKKE